MKGTLTPPDATSSAGTYARTLAASLGGALVAGLILAVLETVLATSGADNLAAGDGRRFLLVALGLYALPSVGLGVAAGVVAAAWRLTFGTNSLRRVWRSLATDRELDQRAVAGTLAGLLAAIVYAGVIAIASLGLVGSVERKGTGAVLLAVMCIAALPLVATLALPAFRLTRVIARAVPRLGPLPATAVLVLGGIAVIVLGAVAFVFGALDTSALALGQYVFLAALPVVMIAVLAAAFGPLAGLRKRIPARGAVVSAATTVAIMLPLLALRGEPTPGVLMILTDDAHAARVFASIGRSLIDGDGDGFSAFLGGPDCDDTDPNVHPDAPEIPGNGIDDNCLGGDRAVAATPADPTGPDPTPPTRRLGFDGNIVVIAVDTLRADKLGTTGYRRGDQSLTPNLDAFASQSAVFTRAYAQAPNTPRSFPSIFTSQFPSQVQVNKSFLNYSKVLAGNVTLWEALADAGYHTVGVSSHFYFVPERGITQGFDVYDNTGAKDIAGSNTDNASQRTVPIVEHHLADLAKSGKKFALFTHLFEPHSRYMTHEGYKYELRGTESLEEKYDWEIHYTDVWLGRILKAIDDNGLADNTMVVLVSDHGEAFGVHKIAGKRMFFHGQTLYDELLRVPMMMRVPGVEPGTYDAPVMLMDMAPTILAAADVPVPPAFRGRSLLPRLMGQELAPRPIYAELLPAPSWNHAWKMIVSGDGRYKLIYRTSDKRFELYDLAEDPQELTNLYDRKPEVAAALQSQLTEWIEVELPRR